MIGIVYGYYVKHGGIGRYISNYLEHIEEQPNALELMVLEKTLPVPEGISFNIINCDRNRDFLSSDENLSFSQGVNEETDKYDLIHSHGIYQISPDIYTAHICFKHYFDAVVEYFGKAELPSNAQDLLDLEREMVSNIREGNKILTAVSLKVAEELSEAYGFNLDEIKIIKGASRFEPIESSITKKRTEGKQITVGFIGGNLSAKGIPFIVAALNELSKKGYEIKCMGAGVNKEIEDYFNRNSDFEYDLYGQIDLDSAFYQSLDVYLALSVYEAYSLSVLEAMSLGIPVVSSNLTGVFYDAKDQNLARVSDITDEKEVAQILEKILVDDKFRSRIITAGKNISAQQSWQTIAQSYQQLYDSLQSVEDESRTY